MDTQRVMYSQLEANIRLAVTEWCWVQGKIFNIQAFCTNQGFKLNRHSRRIINAMVAEGKLLKARRLHTDGKYRVIYEAQRTGKLI